MTPWTTRLAIDFDRHAASTYAANFPGVRVECSDLRQSMHLLSEGMADVITAGPPCPPFSHAGKRQGKNDERNCIPDFIRAVSIVRPRMFLMEQVDGILTGDQMPYFGTVLHDQENLGYVVGWRLFNAVNFGVPQHRWRVWVWGIRSDVHAADVRHAWPKPTHRQPAGQSEIFGDDLPEWVTVGEALGIITGEPSTTLAVDAGNAMPLVHEWSDAIAIPINTLDKPAVNTLLLAERKQFGGSTLSNRVTNCVPGRYDVGFASRCSRSLLAGCCSAHQACAARILRNRREAYGGDRGAILPHAADSGICNTCGLGAVGDGGARPAEACAIKTLAEAEGQLAGKELKQ